MSAIARVLGRIFRRLALPGLIALGIALLATGRNPLPFAHQSGVWVVRGSGAEAAGGSLADYAQHLDPTGTVASLRGPDSHVRVTRHH